MDRRRLLRAGGAALAAAGASLSAKAAWDRFKPAGLKGLETDIDEDTSGEAGLAVEDVRRAYIHNLHTGQMLNAVYYANGLYVPGVLAEAKQILRDWHNGQEHFIDPHLFDLLHRLRGRIETNRPFQILSGYRSPATNAMLHAQSEQVASRSQHILGKALDITVEGVDLMRLHHAARSLRAGGVGYYPESGFVHVDVGPLREWTGA
jgi:uncharacterized protein YcbK (DUF882 family)